MRVFSIHGKPSIEAKDALGFIRAFIDRRIAAGQTSTGDKGGDDIWPVEEDQEHCVWASRRNGSVARSEWTMARATLAGYTARSNRKPNEPSKYETNPIEMLRWKCVMELARLHWSDVLRGVQYSREELEAEASKIITEHRPVKRPAPEAKGIEGLREHRAAMTSDTTVGNPQTTVIDGEAEPAPEPEDKPVEPADSPASSDQLKQIRDIYKKRKLSDGEIRGELTQLLQLDSPLKNVADLTEADAADALRVLLSE